MIDFQGRKKIVVISKRLIPKGAEITYDYQFQLESGSGIPCSCGAFNCAGRLN